MSLTWALVDRIRGRDRTSSNATSSRGWGDHIRADHTEPYHWLPRHRTAAPRHSDRLYDRAGIHLHPLRRWCTPRGADAGPEYEPGAGHLYRTGTRSGRDRPHRTGGRTGGVNRGARRERGDEAHTTCIHYLLAPDTIPLRLHQGPAPLDPDRARS